MDHNPEEITIHIAPNTPLEIIYKGLEWVKKVLMVEAPPITDVVEAYEGLSIYLHPPTEDPDMFNRPYIGSTYSGFSEGFSEWLFLDPQNAHPVFGGDIYTSENQEDPVWIP